MEKGVAATRFAGDFAAPVLAHGKANPKGVDPPRRTNYQNPPGQAEVQRGYSRLCLHTERL